MPIDAFRVQVRAVFDIDVSSQHPYMSADEVLDAAKERLENSLGHVDIPRSEITAVEFEGQWFEAPPF